MNNLLLSFTPDQRLLLGVLGAIPLILIILCGIFVQMWGYIDDDGGGWRLRFCDEDIVGGAGALIIYSLIILFAMVLLDWVLNAALIVGLPVLTVYLTVRLLRAIRRWMRKPRNGLQ